MNEEFDFWQTSQPTNWQTKLQYIRKFQRRNSHTSNGVETQKTTRLTAYETKTYTLNGVHNQNLHA